MVYSGNPDSPRTISRLHAEMMEADPNCGLTLSALRRLVRSGQICSCKVGTKYLVTHAAVAAFLTSGNQNAPTTVTVSGIRRVNL